jgi:hypothetical protein
MKKVFRAFGVAIISGLVITSSFGAVRNITPVQDPIFACAAAEDGICSDSYGGCPDYISFTTTDDSGACWLTECNLNGYSTNSRGQTVCWYDCTYDYCTIA